MKLLGFVGYHKACKNKHSVTTMKVRTLPKSKVFGTTITKKSSFSLEELDINMVSKAMG
jgi:hypothetical protein